MSIMSIIFLAAYCLPEEAPRRGSNQKDMSKNMIEVCILSRAQKYFRLG